MVPSASSVEEELSVGEELDERAAAFRPIHLRRAADEVVLVIADAIRGGLFDVGDRLPSERVLAERLEISRSVVREAIAVLRRAGVVSVSRGAKRGTVVESLGPIPSVLASLQSATQSSLSSLLEVRRPLELTAALLTGLRGTADDFAELDRLARQLESLTHAPDEFYEVDARFHIVVGERSQNPVLAATLRTVMNEIAVLRARYPVGHVEYRLAIANQHATVEAIRSRDLERIATAVDRHLASGEELFLGQPLKFRWVPHAVAT